jgi:bleomycin hydrolase
MKDKNFELSQNYIYFYDQLEKSNHFLNRIIELCDKPTDQMPMVGLLRNPIMDNGQWYVFANVADKYGVVPKSVMPDTQCSPDTRYVTRLLSAKLRWCAWKLRSIYSQDNIDELYSIKEDMLSGIYGILCRFLGEPPVIFSYSYYDDENNYKTIEAITPQDFFKSYCGMSNDDYMMIIHHPSDKYPFMQTYVDRDNLDMGHDVLLNIDMPLIKQMVINQLKGGQQVVMGCDVAKQSYKPTGYMDENLYDYDALFGTEIMDMPKKDRITYRVIKGTHVMTFSGVNIKPDGSPDRWKVQNSYGRSMGMDGYYVMSDGWFDQYVLSVVINKKYAPKAVLEAYEKPPVQMSESERY